MADFVFSESPGSKERGGPVMETSSWGFHECRPGREGETEVTGNQEELLSKHCNQMENEKRKELW